VNRTTKILLAVAGIVVLSYPGVAWVTGIAIEARIQHNEQQALDKTPYLVQVKREYHRGVYRSTEVVTYGLHNPALRSPGLYALFPGGTFTVVSNIQHGPLPGLHTVALSLTDSRVITPPALQKELAGTLGSSSILEFHTKIGLLGGVTGALTSPAFSVRLPDGSALTWGGLTASGTATRNQGHWSGQLNLRGLTFHGPQGTFTLAGLAYTGSQTKSLGELYTGTGTLTIERVDGSTARGQFAVDRISLVGTSKETGEFFDMRIDTTADAARTATVSLKNLTYSVSFEHLHAPSLTTLTDHVRAAQRQAAASPVQRQAAIQDALRQYGGALALHDPVIDIRQLGFSMPEGSLVFSARLGAPGLAPVDLQSVAAVIMALKSHAQITADLRVDNGLMQRFLAVGGSNPRIAAQISTFEQQGYLTAVSTAISTHLQYSGGRLTLNGHPFPPAAPAN
jgi:uncharacterized protein YdgA (DUF945 family)